MKTPLRYGEPLHEMIGADVAQEYLRFVLQIAATGLLEGRSEALIRDRVRAELFTHFRSAEQRLLAGCSGHAEIIGQLANGLRAAFRQSGAGRRDALAQHAVRAKKWESRADDVVKELRSTVRRISGTEIFCGIVETADDAADHLEDAAFLAGLLFESAPPAELPEPLLTLADLLADGTQAFRQTMELRAIRPSRRRARRGAALSRGGGSRCHRRASDRRAASRRHRGADEHAARLPAAPHAERHRPAPGGGGGRPACTRA